MLAVKKGMLLYEERPLECGESGKVCAKVRALFLKLSADRVTFSDCSFAAFCFGRNRGPDPFLSFPAAEYGTSVFARWEMRNFRSCPSE